MPEFNSPSVLAALAAQQSFMLPGFDASYRGLVAQSGPVFGSGTNLLVSQSEIAVKVFMPPGPPTKITGAFVNVSAAGATLTSGQNLLTLYTAAGTKLASCADQSAVWTATGNFNADFTGGPFAIADSYCWVGILSNGTTPATMRSLISNGPWAAVAYPAALSGAALLAGRIGTSVTAPATFTPSTLSVTGGNLYWIGLY